MFEKLLSNLSFNPSLVHQLAFYSKRLKQEKSLRRLGFVFMSLAFVVQFVAFIDPPQATLASSPNDLINGGFASAAEAAQDCRANISDYKDILNNYGISCDQVAIAPTVTIHSTDYNKTLYSMGRLPYNIAGETPVRIAESTYYVRYLWGWDKPGTVSSYQALTITNSAGQRFFLLYACGNVTAIGLPKPVVPITPVVPPVPKPEVCSLDSSILATDPRCKACPTDGSLISSSSLCKPCEAAISSLDTSACIIESKSATNLTQSIVNANNTTAQPGDLIKYTIYANNTGDITVKNYVFQDDLSYVLNYSKIYQANGATVNNQNVIIWPAIDIPAKTMSSQVFEVRVDNPIPQTPTSISDPNYFNLVMSNTYGNTINIKLPGTTAKVIETATTTTLPNTGPGESMVFAAIFVAVAGYFYSRTRLLNRETNLVINDIVGGSKQ